MKKKPDKEETGIICKKNTLLNIINYQKYDYDPNFHGVLHHAIERVNRELFDHYNKIIFRKLNWNTYINIRRNEDLMLNKFEKVMGSPREVIIILGDWSNQDIRGKESTIVIKIRKIFRKRGYIVYLIDEHKTSKLCSHCLKPTENLKVQNDSKILWKLVRCNSCEAIHNRDHNAVKNMMFITREIVIKGKEHLNVFKRNNVHGN